MASPTHVHCDHKQVSWWSETTIHGPFFEGGKEQLPNIVKDLTEVNGN